MITVGIIQELNYISQALGVPVRSSLSVPLAKEPLFIDVNNNYLELRYNNQKIWREEIFSASSMFGIESCDSVSKIIYMIDNNNEDWKNMLYFE